MIVRDDEASGIVDRAFGALVAFVFTLLTFLIAPIVIVSKLWANGSVLKFAFGKRVLFNMFHTPFFVWILLVSILALVYGAYSGTLRTITLLSHLWGTSGDDGMTSKLRAIFIIGLMISIFLMV
jgi:hypothetical protein